MRTFFGLTVPRLLLLCPIALWLTCSLSACGSPPSPCPDGGPPVSRDLAMTTDLTSGMFPAYIPTLMPQILKNPGPVLANPKVVPIFFMGDPMAAQLTTFVESFVSSSAVYQHLSEYGVGAGTILPAATLTETAPTVIADLGAQGVQDWLAGHITGGTLPMPDANTVYLIVYPLGTAVTKGNPVETSCSQFEGYHNDAPFTGNQRVPYAVIARCPFSTPSRITALVSHELAEATTDPFFTSAPAFRNVGDPLGNWSSALGEKIGDLCEHLSDWITVEPGVGTVQRIWSNAAARAFHNPCVPATGPYFVAIPIVSDMNSNRVGATIMPGQTRTIEVKLTCDEATSGPFFVAVPS